MDRIHPATRPEAAEWLEPRLNPFGSGVGSIVPTGFPAYVRILHPASGPNDVPIRWAEVAARSGSKMHRLVQFDAMNRLSELEVSAPPQGDLSSDLLEILCTSLAGQTSTPGSCFFGLWEGFGWLRHHAQRTALMSAPRLYHPQRSYLLFEGPLDAATEFGWDLTAEHFVPQSPTLFWPEDRAWCVASEIDLYFTLVACSNAAAEDLINHTHLEAWRVFPDDPVHSNSDLINL